MNDIVKPLTPDGMCGWDNKNQLWITEIEGRDRVMRPIRDPRGHKCRICLQGWILTVESLKDQRYSDDFEEYTHLSCFIRYVSMTDRATVFRGLVGAGIRFDKLQEIPNGYSTDPSDPWNKRSWFVATCKDSFLVFMIGFRKHVWSIEVVPTNQEVIATAASLKIAFQGERVTNEISEKRVLVHADSSSKLEQYLLWISNNLGLKELAKKAVSEEAQ